MKKAISTETGRMNGPVRAIAGIQESSDEQQLGGCVLGSKTRLARWRPLLMLSEDLVGSALYGAATH